MAHVAIVVSSGKVAAKMNAGDVVSIESKTDCKVVMLFVCGVASASQSPTNSFLGKRGWR